MGSPQNFSLDIPKRCQALIDSLWPAVSAKGGGGSLPLNASFLLAISTPMINLPIERIWKPQMNRAVGHLNDGVLNQQLAATIRNGIGKTAAAKANFYRTDAWSYVYLAKGNGYPNLSLNGLPLALEAELNAPAARLAAANLATEEFCQILRNGLAHGGVIYLDKDGRSTWGNPVQKFCFVSTKRTRKSGDVGLHLLRVGMRDYREFLKLWVRWLETPREAQ